MWCKNNCDENPAKFRTEIYTGFNDGFVGEV